MKIREPRAASSVFDLTRPYAIAGQEPLAEVGNLIVRLETESGLVGLGAGISRRARDRRDARRPPPRSRATASRGSSAATPDASRPLPRGREPHRRRARRPRGRRHRPPRPRAQRLGVPLVGHARPRTRSAADLLTIGIKPVAETLAEADEYLGRGFTRPEGQDRRRARPRPRAPREAARAGRVGGRDPRRRQHRIHRRGDRALLRAHGAARNRVRRAAGPRARPSTRSAPRATAPVADRRRREPPSTSATRSRSPRRPASRPAGSSTSSS